MTMTLNVSRELATVYFSKNRPMQLELALTTHESHCREAILEYKAVLYTASNDRFEEAYEKLAYRFSNVMFVKQKSFKKDLLDIINYRKYLLFVVDDCIFTHDFSIAEMVGALDLFHGAIGFSLRLGKNTTNCYPIAKENIIPTIYDFTNNICAFNWMTAGQGDFSYPLEVSSSFYRTSDIFPMLESANYNTPNTLEWQMYLNLKFYKYFPFLLSYKTSVAFCNPVNKVQNENNNRAVQNADYSTGNLLDMFSKGVKIDPKPFNGFVSSGAHQEVPFEFIG